MEPVLFSFSACSEKPAILWDAAAAPAMTDSITWPHVVFPAQGRGFSREANRVWYHSTVFGDTAGFPSTPRPQKEPQLNSTPTLQGSSSVSLLIS